MKHPEGALKTIKELKEAAVPGAVFYMIFDSPTVGFKVTITESTTIRSGQGKWRFTAHSMDMENKSEWDGHEFWSPYGDLHFPTTVGHCGYLFANYWHAYAYALKCEKAA